MDTGAACEGQKTAVGVGLTLKPRQSLCACFMPSAPELPAGRELHPAGTRRDISSDWTIQLIGQELDRAWRPVVGETRVSLPVFRAQPRNFQKWPDWNQSDYDDHNWRRVHALRGNALFTEASPILLRATLPPGAKALETPLPLTGEYQFWINGHEVAKDLHPPSNRPATLPLEKWIHGVHDTMAIETVSHAGPAGLDRPITIRCGPVRIDRLRSWQNLGFDYFAGRVLYRKHVTLDSRPRRLWLDLGQVEHYVEVYVNGKLAGTLLWPPYELDITRYGQPGDNELVLVVSNSVANRFAWDVWGTRGTGRTEPSGILGPAWLGRE
jgi:hypothetical protein